MPFPREETTPPVTKTNLVMTFLVPEIVILLDLSGLAKNRRSSEPGGATPQAGAMRARASFTASRASRYSTSDRAAGERLGPGLRKVSEAITPRRIITYLRTASPT